MTYTTLAHRPEVGPFAELEPLLLCPNCGAEAYELLTEEDCDPSVGYRGEVTHCGCIKR